MSDDSTEQHDPGPSGAEVVADDGARATDDQQPTPRRRHLVAITFAVAAAVVLLDQITKALAVELAEKNIRVNCVAPGPIATDFFDYEGVTSPEAMEFMGQRLLVKRIGKPADIASAVSWLLSDEASWIDGIQLPVDGGWLTR